MNLLIYLFYPLILLIPSFSLICFFGIITIFAEDYLSKIVNVGMYLINSFVWKVSYIISLSYWIVCMFGIMYVLIKVMLTTSMIIGNLISVYLFGVIAVFIMFFTYIISFGVIMFSFLFLSFISNLASFLYVLLLLDAFSQFFQSITLTNRLSINMLCGSLLTTLLSLFIKTISIQSLFILSFLFIIFMFELFNTMVQLFIFMVLSFEYLMI